MHFIFDLIRKILAAKRFGKTVLLWGDGYQKRELILAEDFVRDTKSVAAICSNSVINMGAGCECDIRSYASMICSIVDYDPARIRYDELRYVGAKSKCLDISKLKQILPARTLTPLADGLRLTIQWFRQHEDVLLVSPEPE
jgi:GDP-L-fucose synthase